MKKGFLFLPLALISLASCSSKNGHESLSIQGKTLILHQETCSIKTGEKILPLDMKGECYFLKNNGSDTIRVEYYDDVQKHIALIVGNPLEKDPDYPSTLKRSDCGSSLRALLITSEKTSIADKISSDMVVCAGNGTDEKMYYMLSH